MEASVYDQFAELQEDHFWFRGRRNIFDSLLEGVVEGGHEGAEGRRVLEIGCGPGAMLSLMDRYGDVHALDISYDSMRECQKRGFQKVAAGDGTELPYADDSFDVIALFDTIEHIDDDVGVLAEVRRVLKPGGVVFVSVPAYQFLYCQNDRLVHHKRRYTKRMLRQRFEKAGLAPKRLTYFNTFLFPLILPAVLLLKLKEKLVGLPDGQTNLSHNFMKPVHDLFAWFMGSERHLLKHMEFPFGHSLVGVARPQS